VGILLNCHLSVSLSVCFLPDNSKSLCGFSWNLRNRNVGNRWNVDQRRVDFESDPGHTRTTVLRPFFRDYPGEPVPEEIFIWTFMMQGKTTETSAIWMCATPSGLISGPPLSSPPFLRWMPFLLQPFHFILACDRHQRCWLAYPVAWSRTHSAYFVALTNSPLVKWLKSGIEVGNTSYAHCGKMQAVTTVCWFHCGMAMYPLLPSAVWFILQL